MNKRGVLNQKGERMKRERIQNKKTIAIIVLMILISVGVITYFIYINIKKEDEGKTEAVYEESELNKLLKRDLSEDYPPTAREVLKFYSRILCQFYGDTQIEDEDFDILVDQLRELYASELLEENSKETQIQNLKDEIQEYRDISKKIRGYQIEKADSAISWESEEKELQRLIAVYTFLQNNRTGQTYEEFLLCKEDGKWKILGWNTVDGAEMDFY